MMRKSIAVLLFCLGAGLLYAAETVVVDSKTRDVVNTGVINFANGQLRVGGVNVGPGGGDGGGTITDIVLSLPATLFQSPVDFTIDSAGTATGSALLANAPNNSVLANFSGGAAVPNWQSLTALKTAAGLDNLDNTSDANKPVSVATQTALNLKADVTAMNTALSAKADTSALTSGLNAKEDLLPNTSVNGYILSRQTNGTYSWVDPVTLGTTSYNGTDGVSNSSTTYTSATANFVAGDVGLTITGTDIPAGTTIASRTNATTIVLSQAATGSHTGNSFTIVNRLLPAGGTGTVTNFSAGDLSPLFTTTEATTTTTPALSFNLSTAAANTVFGNNTGSTAAPGFQTLVDAQVPDILTLTRASNLTTNGFVKTSGGNGTLSVDTTAAYELPLTFNAPFSRSGNIVSMSAASGGGNGYLSSTDWGHFNTAYLISPQTVLASSCTGSNPCVLDLSAGANPPINRILLTTVLADDLKVIMPPSANYNASVGFEALEIMDVVGGAQGTKGVSVTGSGANTVDGVAAGTLVAMPRSASYMRFAPNGTSKWVSTNYYTTAFVDRADKNKIITVDVSALPSPAPNPNYVFRPATTGDSVSVVPTDSGAAGFIKDIGSNGTATKTPPTPSDMVPIEEVIGTVGVDISGSSKDVTTGGIIDTIRIAGNLVSSYTIRFPNASDYPSGFPLVLIDASGTVSSSHPVTVTSQNGTDLFPNGQTSIIFDEPNGRKVFTSDGNANWNVTTVKTSIQPFQVLAPGQNNTFTISGNTSAVRHNAHIPLANGNNILAVDNPYDGMDIYLTLIQPSSGTRGSLFLPVGSRVEPSGAGVVTLSATNGNIDTLHGTYNGALTQFLWDAPKGPYTSASVPTAPSTLATGTVTASTIALTWADNSSNESGFALERCAGASCSNFNLIATYTAGTNSATDTGVSADTDYSYRIRAFNSAGYSTYSNTATAHTAMGGPTADLWEVHFNDGTGNTRAHATAGPDAILSYATDWITSNLPAGSTGAALHTVVGMAGTSGLTATPTCSGTCATSYTYKVLAWKNDGVHHNGFSGNGFAVTNASTLDGTHFNHLSWTAVTGAQYYTVYRVASGGTNGLGALVGTGPGFTNTTFDDMGATSVLPLPVFTATDIHSAQAETAVDYTHAGAVTGDKLSVSFWAKSVYNTATNTIAVVDGGTGSWRIMAANTGTNGKFQITFPRGTGTESGTASMNVSSGGNTINSGTGWHNIVVTMDNSTTNHGASQIQVFYDGNNPQTVSYVTTGTNQKIFTNSAPVVGSQTLAADVKDVRVYGHILSGSEVAAIFSGNAQ